MKEVVRKGKFLIRQSKSTAGWAAFAYILEKHGGQNPQRLGGLTEGDLFDLRDVIEEFTRALM